MCGHGLTTVIKNKLPQCPVFYHCPKGQREIITAAFNSVLNEWGTLDTPVLSAKPHISRAQVPQVHLVLNYLLLCVCSVVHVLICFLYGGMVTDWSRGIHKILNQQASNL